jgi:3-hydroxy-9,10-secoandrosta-1,3,5(10)-triene-9,17-dione monooxygenase reductase component
VSVTPEAFKSTLRLFASGITIVATRTQDAPHGMTCTSFASLSLEPPLVLVCLERDSHTLEAVSFSGAFAVSVLSAGQEAAARSFSRPGHKPFDDFPMRDAPNGSPILDGSLAWVACSVERNLETGDHNIVVGLVEDCDFSPGEPLLYFDRDYRKFS